MNNPMDWNEANMDFALLERVNPVFQTAKMTLFQLAANGDQDAIVLAKNMGLTLEATQNSATTTASPEQVLGGTIMLETRYRTMERLAEESGCTLVDLPCGYTPRAIAFAKKGLLYYGLDLPVVIREASEQIPALIPPERRGRVHCREVDATNYASLEKALEDVDGSVCITTEGLLMYFTDSEAGALCDNIRRILEKKGGCWYTADVESPLQYVITMRALVGDRFMEIMQNAKRQTMDKSDVEVGKNALITKPADMSGSIRSAMAFLAKHGLKAERVTVAEHMPELHSLSKISSRQAEAVREGMKHCAFWKITPGASAPGVELPASESEGFGIRASMLGSTLSLTLSGRLDTITAPNLLSFFEKAQAERPADAVTVDCSRLDYISSAGPEILSQTGFDSILNIIDNSVFE